MHHLTFWPHEINNMEITSWAENHFWFAPARGNDYIGP